LFHLLGWWSRRSAMRWSMRRLIRASMGLFFIRFFRWPIRRSVWFLSWLSYFYLLFWNLFIIISIISTHNAKLFVITINVVIRNKKTIFISNTCILGKSYGCIADLRLECRLTIISFKLALNLAWITTIIWSVAKQRTCLIRRNRVILRISWCLSQNCFVFGSDCGTYWCLLESKQIF